MSVPTLRPFARRTPAALAGVLLAVLLAACGAASPTPTPTPLPTPTPSPTPTATPSATPGPAGLSVSAAAQAYLVSLDGYTYEALSETTEQTMAAGLASNPVVTAAIKGYAASAVNLNGSLVAVAVVIEFNPAVSSLPEMADAFWSGAAGSLDTTASTSTIAGQEVRVIDSPASKVVGWQADELMVLVFAPQMAPAQDVAAALLEAHA